MPKWLTEAQSKKNINSSSASHKIYAHGTHATMTYIGTK